MRNKIHIFLFSVSAIIIIVIFILIRRTVINESEDKSSDDITTLYAAANQIYFSSITDGKTIDENQLTEYIRQCGLQKRPLLLIKYSAYDCSECQRYIFDRIEDYLPDVNSRKEVIFVASDYNKCDKQKYDNTIILDWNKSLGLSIEDIHLPFLFVYDGEIKHLFIPDPSRPEWTDVYLSTIVKRYNF